MKKMTIFEIKEKVAYVTINRPEVRNCINPYVLYELSQHFDEIENNDDIWLAVITGAGDKAFSAGADLKFASQYASLSEDERNDLREIQKKTRNPAFRWDFPKPLIARVNGFAMGGGLELAMSCDIIVAVDDTELGLPEPKRGLVAGWAGVHRLPRQIGLKPAMGFMLTGRHIPAKRAFELGLVNDAVPRAELDSVVDGYVQDILACAPLSVRATKEMAMQGLNVSLSEAYGTKCVWEKRRRSSPDAAEGPRAFAEKRAPRWTGKFED